jgi:hypothetical protein
MFLLKLNKYQSLIIIHSWFWLFLLYYKWFLRCTATLLLPPSSFESTAGGHQGNNAANVYEPWTTVLKAVNEVTDLLDSYKQLR